MSDAVRTRFAPSPTGYLHVGGARTALFSWLHARRHGGRFILRVEDTDAARNTEAAFAAILDGLRWLGIDWDEGPDVGGRHGPYRQSERRAIYDRHLLRLAEAGHTYDDQGAIRFRFDRGAGPTQFTDRICGPVSFDLSDPETSPDMTIRRPDGSYIFHFVNVVDDIEMGITTVMRGDDHLPNTPKHIALYRALGHEPPEFAHIPLILNADGSKMSKRDQGAAVQSYMDDGFLPEAVRNYLCLLGWSPKDDREKLAIDEVIARFDWPNLNRKSASFDLEKCRWLNGQYLQAMPLDQAWLSARPFITGAGLPADDPERGRAILAIVRPKVRLLSELPEWFGWFEDDRLTIDPAAVDKALGDPDKLAAIRELRAQLAHLKPWSGDAVQSSVAEVAARHDTKPGKLMLPLRVAVTGQTSGPDLLPLLQVIGRDSTLARIDRVLATASES